MDLFDGGSKWGRWIDRVFTGHVTLGPVTIFGANAMHWAIQVRTRWGYLVAHPTTRTFGERWPWYVMLSPDGTPSSATFILGPGSGPDEKRMARWRRNMWGHGYDPDYWNPRFPEDPEAEPLIADGSGFGYVESTPPAGDLARMTRDQLITHVILLAGQVRRLNAATAAMSAELSECCDARWDTIVGGTIRESRPCQYYAETVRTLTSEVEDLRRRLGA